VGGETKYPDSEVIKNTNAGLILLAVIAFTAPKVDLF